MLKKMFETTQKNFILRNFQATDLLTLIKIADAMNKQDVQDKNYHAYYALAVPYHTPDYQNKLIQKGKAFLEKNAKEMQQNPRITYRMAVCTPDKRLIGGIAIDMMPHLNENNQFIYGDLGYFITPSEGGRGIIPEVVKYVLPIYFKHFARLDFTIHPDNIYSQKVAEKLNAKSVGFIEKSSYENQPRIQYCLLKKEFEKMRTVCRSEMPVLKLSHQNQRG